MNTNTFWKLLFDEDDHTCFAAKPTDWAVEPVYIPGNIPANTQYFSINALSPVLDANPTESWHDISLPRRADHNVTKHRTFLFEFDDMLLVEQNKLIKSFPVPLTAAVFSGNKSVHFFVALQTPVTAEEYAIIWKRIAAVLPAGLDKSTKNPSRLARTPGAMRTKNGEQIEQELLYLGQRVNNQLLLEQLPKLYEPVEPVKAPKDGTTVFQRVALIEARENPEEVMRQLGCVGRNAFFFWLGMRLKDDNKPYDFKLAYIRAVYEALENKKDFTWNEAKLAARL